MRASEREGRPVMKRHSSARTRRLMACAAGAAVCAASAVVAGHEAGGRAATSAAPRYTVGITNPASRTAPLAAIRQAGGIVLDKNTAPGGHELHTNNLHQRVCDCRSKARTSLVSRRSARRRKKPTTPATASNRSRFPARVATPATSSARRSSRPTTTWCSRPIRATC